MVKKFLSTIVCAALCTSLLAACSADPDSGSTAVDNTTEVKEEVKTEETAAAETEAVASTGVTLEVETTWTAEKLDSLQALMNQFTNETGIAVELIAPGDDYENVMKTRMASNDLPDLWETHGWSTTRYKEYLTPLEGEAWAPDVQDDIKKTVTAEDGSIYVIPLSIDPASMCYNKTLFEDAGVNAADIKTWADFENACDKIKDSGVVPVYVGGNDVNNIANLFEVIAPGYLTNDGVPNNQSEALLNGTFDWATYWTPIAEMLAGWMNKGYFNVDILTASDDAAIQALANGEGAIVISGNHTITSALTYNPDAQLGIMPIPTDSEEATPYISSGEGTCYGIWKDTKYPEECKKLIEFFARPEVCKEIATVNGKIPGLKNISNEDAYVTKEFNAMQEAFAGNLMFIQYFDREFLPSGMWNDMGVSGNEVFMDTSDAGISKCIENISAAYSEKFTQ